jgi:uncharacterized membrane protein
MAHVHERVLALMDPEAAHPRLAIRKIGFADLKDALIRGIDDFIAMPSHAFFLCLIYPFFGLLLGRLAFGYAVLPLLYPMAAGFALIGPFAAIGLYELSRRREAGLVVRWSDAFEVVRSRSFRSITMLGVVLLAIFALWIVAAQAIFVAYFGDAAAASIAQFVHLILETPEGHTLILVGNAVGFLFALLVLTISVVSFPLLLDRNVGVVEAVLTSARAVKTNPVAMAAWGVIVAALLAAGSLPFFFALAIVVPVLGHATWHLYRKVIER